MTTRRVFASIAATVLAMLATAPPAGAATQLGETFSPTSGCADRDYLQTASPGIPYAAPSAGVITSWSHLAGTPPASPLRFKVARPLGGDAFAVIGVSELKFPLPSQLNTYDIRIPVGSGDVIGLHTPSGPCSRSAAGFGYHFSFVGDDPPAGTTYPYVFAAGNIQLDISATLEPDADNDGFGDETQDACPTDASKQGDCAAPETEITRAPKQKTNKKQATLEFVSSEPGSSFECSLDGSGFEACISPLIAKAGKGKHSFQVRARDAAGNVDGSPAAASWKVKKKKKK